MAMFGTEWAAWSAPAQQPVTPPAPPPPSAQLPQTALLSIDEAWALFGIAKKRGTRIEVKKKYLAYAIANHPDKHPGDEAAATEKLRKANVAWGLLEKHCKW